jgi:hypothetical protein
MTDIVSTRTKKCDFLHFPLLLKGGCAQKQDFETEENRDSQNTYDGVSFLWLVYSLQYFPYKRIFSLLAETVSLLLTTHVHR